jgi:signal transduction histidine kinase
MNIQQKANELTADLSSQERNLRITDIEKDIEVHKELARKLILQNPRSTVAYFAIYQKINDTYLFSPYVKVDKPYCAAVATSYNAFMPDYERTKNLYSLVMDAIHTERKAKQDEAWSEVLASAGAGYIDIVLNDKNNVERKLSELEGKLLIDLIHPEDIEDTKLIFNKLTTNSEAETFINRLKCKNGTYRFIEWKFYSLNNLIFATARDISQRILDEEEIKRKNNELVKTNAEKDKFFSIIAHDLKSPFNGLLGLSEMLATDIEQFSKEEIQNVAKSMKSSATYLFKLLENLLEWSRIQRGVIKNNPINCQLSEYFNQNISLNSTLISKKSLNVSNTIDSNLFVSADSHFLNSVIRNIISNAIKYTNLNGLIEISANKINDKLIHISVKDNGIGISENYRDELFRIDQINSSPGTEGEMGTGLGLVLCKEYIERSGGKIWIESELEKGTTINFTLKTI